MNILIADDEIDMLKILKAYFEKEKYNVFVAEDGEKALELFYNEKIDLVVLDWMMPKLSGIELCKEIKLKSNNTKVLMLTAKVQDDDELMALNIGADEYIKKPFNPRILLIRAKKLLKEENIIYIDDLKIDLNCRKVYKNEDELKFTKREFELMECFLKNRGSILCREKILNTVWGFDYFGDNRTVDTHIRRLREKLGEDFIKTYRGMGYCFEKEND